MQLTLIVSNLNEEGGGRGGSKPLTLVTVDSRFERFFKSKFTRCARVVSNSGSRYLQSLLTCRGTVDRLKERVIDVGDVRKVGRYSTTLSFPELMSLRYARTASPFFARLDLFLAVLANEAVATRKNHPSKLANSRRVGLQSFVSKPDFPNPFVKDAKSRAAITNSTRECYASRFELVLVTSWEFVLRDDRYIDECR